MKCEIIRDLFPSYIDELTSEESNQLVEKHLRECEKCRKYFASMREDIHSGRLTEEERKKRKEEIQPLRKVRKANFRRVMSAIFLTAVICAILFGVYEMYYGYGTTADYKEVKITYEKVTDVVTVGFLPKNDKIYITVGKGERGLEVVKYRVSPFSKPIRAGGYYGVTFVDENTILNPEGGGTIDLTGEETITINFADQTKEVKIIDLYTEKGIEDLK